MNQKTGDETFEFNSKPQGFQLKDFWRWQSSDLLDNTLRGVLAEFIVAKALGVSTEGTGFGWGGYDVLFDENGKKVKIEVKASAYVQSWNREGEISNLNFSISKKAEWLPDKKRYGDNKSRKSDMYIFCVLKEKSKSAANPLNLNQWDFYPVLTSDIDNKYGDRKTASINLVKKMCPKPYDFQSLRDAVLSLSEQVDSTSVDNKTIKSNIAKSSL